MNVMILKPTKKLQIRRIKRAEEACKRAETNWSKNFWFSIKGTPRPGAPSII